MSDEEAPKIEFPCDYPIKVIGDAADDFPAMVEAVMRKHDSSFSADTLQIMDSSKGNYMSVRVTIVATGEAQLKAIFEELKSSGRVKMVL